MEIRVQLEELAMCLEYNLFDSECVINELLEVMRTKKYQIKGDTNDYYNKYLLTLINQNSKIRYIFQIRINKSCFII